MARRLILWAVGLTLAAIALAQSPNLLTRFGPVTGILVGTAGSPVTHAAVASDIEALISPLPIVNGGIGATSLAAAAIPTISGTPTSGHCTSWASASTVGDSGAPCSIPLSGTTAAIGGSALAAGACAADTATVTGATTSMVATTSPSADPDSTLSTGVAIYAFVSSLNTVTVRICAIVAVTPASTIYNVRVLP